MQGRDRNRPAAVAAARPPTRGFPKTHPHRTGGGGVTKDVIGTRGCDRVGEGEAGT